LKTYRKLADRENRPFLDVLNHQMGVFMINKTRIKKGFYNTSLKKTATDQYLVASNYRNIEYVF
jgi:hypothetical protein